jgi:hypothetical protein
MPPAGFESKILAKQAAADLCLGTRGHRDRQNTYKQSVIILFLSRKHLVTIAMTSRLGRMLLV